MLKRNFYLAMCCVALITSSVIAAPQQNVNGPAIMAEEKKDIVETAAGAGSFNTLIAAAKAAGLVEALQGEGPITVFAPTDDAFAKLPAGTVENLLKPENKGQLASILLYHVIPGRTMAADVVNLKRAETLQGSGFKIEGATVNGANITKTDIECSNGVIHVIDSVILPPKDIVDTAVGAGSFGTLVAAAKAAGLVETLKGPGPYTVFAPTDEAFKALPEGTVASLLKPENKDQLASILTYHVVPSRLLASDVVKMTGVKSVQGANISVGTTGGARVDKANIVATDIECSNGVIHVIDAVILPPAKTPAKVGAMVNPHQMIQQAINVGVPAFNAGHHSRCAEVYTGTINQLLDSCGDRMTSDCRSHLMSTLTTAQQTHRDDSRAWVLRQGLDNAYSMIPANR